MKRFNIGRVLSRLYRNDVNGIVKTLQDTVDALEEARKAHKAKADAKLAQIDKLTEEIYKHRSEAQRAHRVCQKVESLIK